MKRVFGITAVMALLLGAAFTDGGPGVAAGQEQVGEIGSQVSEFSLPTYDGGTITDAALKDKVTLIVFWYAT